MCKYSSFFFFNDTATTEIYTLSLHDALPISVGVDGGDRRRRDRDRVAVLVGNRRRSEEHTSELQSLTNLVCRLLLEKKNIGITDVTIKYHRPLANVRKICGGRVAYGHGLRSW